MSLDGDVAPLFPRAEVGTTRPSSRAPRIRAGSRSGCRLALLLLIAPATLGVAAARPAVPVGVAPGGTSDTKLATACSSFHWGASRSALRFELVVYEVDDESGDGPLREAEPALSVLVPAAASSWTPPLDQCLKTGATYAWSLRAIHGDGPSAWAAPLFFRVPLGPSPAEVAEAIEWLRQLRRESPEAIAIESQSDIESHSDSVALPDAPGSRLRTIQGGIIEPPGPAEFSGGGPASLRVGGEARTVDATGEPRLWGKGRPGAKIYGPDNGSGAFCSQGSIEFGLSEGVASWDSAEAACPEGTWVCRQSEIQAAPACDTARPDTATDVLLCDGDPLDQLSDRTYGWLADHPAPANGFGTSLSELDIVGGLPACVSAPVWCCRD